MRLGAQARNSSHFVCSEVQSEGKKGRRLLISIHVSYWMSGKVDLRPRVQVGTWMVESGLGQHLRMFLSLSQRLLVTVFLWLKIIVGYVLEIIFMLSLIVVLWRLLEFPSEVRAVYNPQSCADSKKRVNLVYIHKHWRVGILA